MKFIQVFVALTSAVSLKCCDAFVAPPIIAPNTLELVRAVVAIRVGYTTLIVR
jgi:hypothetical protein